MPTGAAQISIFDAFSVKPFDGVLEGGGENFDGCNRSWTEITEYTDICPSDMRKRVVDPDHISASIDITGYRGTSSFDNVDYIGGCPAELAIIKQSVSTSYAGFEANKDYVKRVITVRSANGNTTATMHVTFLWHWTTHSSVTGTNRKHYRIEYKTVSVTKPHPTVMTCPTNVTAHITVYNNTISPRTMIDVPIYPSIYKTSFTYDNTMTLRYNKVGIVDGDVVNFTDAVIWKGNHTNGCALIKNSSPNLDLFNVSVSTPYETVYATDYNITIINSKPTDYINDFGILSFLIVIGIFVWGIINIARGLRR